MTKRQMAEIIIKSPIWDGIKNVEILTKLYKKSEIQDMYEMLEQAEYDYYSYTYGCN